MQTPESQRYSKSLALYERATKVIPLGSQTFSKSITQYPKGVSPLFVQRGKGSKVWDVDGNQYIDFNCSLCAINLGYCDPDVDAAVQRQLQDGAIFSLPSPLETEVAEKIAEVVPGAEGVRFGKNGSDATAGAVRIARAYTKRDHVLTCGYHGWQDWYIGSTTRNRGVPAAVSALTHRFAYNDLDSLQKLFKEYHGQVACVIMEAANLSLPEKDFLKECQELAKKNGALFILDETITGFRYAKGGAQELFGVVPDLSTFGKGMGNGYPISAVVGKMEYMRLMEEIFFSFTFGGECLSLAAAKATIEKISREPVIEQMEKQGRKVMDLCRQLIKKFELESMLSVSGHPTWNFLSFKDGPVYTGLQMKTFYLQEAFKAGILAIGTHNMCYAHSDEDIRALESAYTTIFAELKKVSTEKTLDRYLKVKPLELLFKVR